VNVGDNYNRPKVFDLFYNLFCNNESKRTGTIKIRNKQLNELNYTKSCLSTQKKK